MAPDDAAGETDGLVVPLHEEALHVDRRMAETATVRVHIHTATREQVVAETLSRVAVEVERVPIGRPIASVPAVREEGDTTIVPVVEEVLVVERRLVLKEEIHLRRVRTEETHRETVTLRVQDVEISRVEHHNTGGTTS